MKTNWIMKKNTMKNRQDNDLSRRSFLKMVGAGTAATLFVACGGKKVEKLVKTQLTGEEAIPCTGCQNCMPCPYGIDIAGIFQHYNQWKANGKMPENKDDANWAENRRSYLISLDRTISRERQPDHCIGCNHCMEDDKCPNEIRIPRELQHIDELIEQARRG